MTTGQVKLYSSLKYKKFRRQYGLFIADGPHLVEAAIESGWDIERVIVRPESIDLAIKLKVPRHLLSMAGSQQLKKLSPSLTPQGILAIVKSAGRADRLPRIIEDAESLIACDNITDPGNLGTIIRTAAAFYYDAVILLGDCAEIYNPKVVRATQGGLFKIPVIEQLSVSRFIKDLAGKFDTVVLSHKASAPLSSAPEIRRPLLVVGGETAGVSPEITEIAGYRFKIEQSSEIESLNAAVAAGVAMYKFCRQ